MNRTYRENAGALGPRHVPMPLSTIGMNPG
jgi:hypothetical protein